MAVRKCYLSEGWYPQDQASASRDLDKYLAEATRHAFIMEPRCLAAVAPHASWFYSGTLATAAVSALRRDAETVVIFGGHLPDHSEPLMAEDDSFSTPLGPLESDVELSRLLSSRFSFRSDRISDNTVEIQLPLIKRFFSASRIVWLRMPASMEAFELGKTVYELASALGRTIVALGSTDLTHYGPNYGFMPKGTGEGALRWVRETNDKRFIDALLEGNAEKAISLALDESSACSPGGAVAALGFAQAAGAGNARLLGYGTSADVSPASSFVGYAAISWAPK
ncbi:MAG: AmmeMemoRadiSam system protein B [Treponemataceae bacterium]